MTAPYQTLLGNTVPAQVSGLKRNQGLHTTNWDAVPKPGGHQKVVIKVQCHPSHSGPGSPQEPPWEHGEQAYKLRQQRLPSHPEGYRVGILIPKSPSVTGKATPRALTLQNFPPVLWVTKQARAREIPAKKPRCCQLGSQAVCAKVAKLGASVGHQQHLPGRVCMKMEEWAGATGKRSNFWGGSFWSYFSYNMPCCTLWLPKKFMFPNKGYSTNTWPALLKPIKVFRKKESLSKAIKDKKSLRRYDSQP